MSKEWEEEEEEGQGQDERTQSQKVNKNHNSDNFIYNTLEELYFIYSFKCDDEAAESRLSTRLNSPRLATGNGQADRNPGTCPPFWVYSPVLLPLLLLLLLLLQAN